MSVLESPKLRPLVARELTHDGQPYVALECPFGLFVSPLLVSRDWYIHVVRHFNGVETLGSIQSRIRDQLGQEIPVESLRDIASRLDGALALEGSRFQKILDDYRDERVRPPSHAGASYPSDPNELRAMLARHVDHPDGVRHGLKARVDAVTKGSKLRGILSPHIDFGRGGPVYSWAYDELLRRSDAEIYVILGVAHSFCRRRFALTRKDFQTPLSVATTDQEFIDRIVEETGTDFFDDELAHRREHSVEFQVVQLQHVLQDSRPYTIVPILVGSFHDLMERGIDPIDDPEVARFVASMKRAEEMSGKRVVYIGGIDLCHVGPQFGDPSPVSPGTLDEVRQFDSAMLDRAQAADPSGWFALAASVDDRWRVCGLSATYTIQHLMGPARGRLLKYKQAIDPPRTCCVTFASVVYDAVEPSDEV